MSKSLYRNLERKSEHQQKVIEALAGNFDLVCLIEVATNREEIFKFDESRRGMLPWWDEVTDFTDRLNHFKDSVVHPDDRRIFFEATRKQKILDEVRKNGEYFFTYRNKVGDQITYWKALFGTVELETEHIVAGFLEITESYLKSKKEHAELTKQLSIIKGLSGEYLNVCFMDLTEDTLENVAYDDEFLENVCKVIDNQEDVAAAYKEYVEKLVHPDDRASVKSLLDVEYVRDLLKEQKRCEFKYRALYGSKYKWTAAILVKAEDADAPAAHVAIGFNEIDEQYMAQQTKEKIRKQYENELIAARDKAEEANRAKSKFLFSMSHDIRTPMNAITGYTAMAKKNIDDKIKVKDCLNKIETAGGNLLELVNQVLDMSRIESGKLELALEPADVVEKSRELTEIIRQTADAKDIKVIFSDAGVRNTKVYADSGRMNQILTNILGNAVKYTPVGGTVTFSVSELPSEVEGAGTYLFTVEDTGIGMSPEFLETIYEPFSRETTSTISHIEGTGLGMSIVKRLVDLMDGSIDIESEKGRGTKVHVEITFRLQEDEETEGDGYEIEGASLLKGKRVLVVEDNEMNREITTELLKDYGFIVEEAEDGDIAVDMMKAVAERHEYDYYDAVLMDIQMPRLNGYDATKAIRAIQAPEGVHVPIIALSANAYEEDRLNSLESGMDEHLAKPIDVTELIEMLMRFI